MPKGRDVRPTLDKVREAVFNILGGGVKGCRVLDLYAGSGGLGIEAISRGAEFAVFSDHNLKCIKAINENLQRLGLNERTKVLKFDAGRALRYLASRSEAFDLIFLDPPYGDARKSLQMVSESATLSPSSIVVVEHHKGEAMPEHAGGLTLKKAARYGDTTISIYENEQQ